MTYTIEEIEKKLGPGKAIDLTVNSQVVAKKVRYEAIVANGLRTFIADKIEENEINDESAQIVVSIFKANGTSFKPFTIMVGKWDLGPNPQALKPEKVAHMTQELTNQGFLSGPGAMESYISDKINYMALKKDYEYATRELDKLEREKEKANNTIERLQEKLDELKAKLDKKPSAFEKISEKLMESGAIEKLAMAASANDGMMGAPTEPNKAAIYDWITSPDITDQEVGGLVHFINMLQNEKFVKEYTQLLNRYK